MSIILFLIIQYVCIIILKKIIRNTIKNIFLKPYYFSFLKMFLVIKNVCFPRFLF